MINAKIAISGVTSGEQRSRREYGDMEGLAASIKSEGLYHPIVVTSSGRLVAGERRLRACRDILGWTEIPARIVDDSTPAAAEYHENEHRKDLTSEERAAVVDRLRSEESKTVEEATTEAGISSRTYYRQQTTTVKHYKPRKPSLKPVAHQASRLADKIAVSHEAIASAVRPDREAVKAAFDQLRTAMDAHEAKMEATRLPKHDPKPKAVTERPEYEPISDEALDDRWRRCTHKQRAAAEAKAAVIGKAVDRHESTGEPLTACLKVFAGGIGLSPSTLYAYYCGRGQAPLTAYSRLKWPQVLVAKWRSGRGAAECHPTAWEAWKADYLRVEEPTLAQTYRRLKKLAEEHGWQIPSSPKTLLSRLRNEMHPAAIALARKGPQALLESKPPATRDYESVRVLGLWNADGRESDVVVLWPDGKEARPWITAWQDVRSRKIVGWRVDRSESSDSYRLALADAVREWGVPDAVLLDNSSGAASQMLTGGCHWRFKGGKPKPGEVAGLLTQLVGPKNIHWSKPYRGRSKPVERGFRDLASNLDKDHRLRGAYTGSNPTRKPHYGLGDRPEKPAPVELQVYLEVVQGAIAEHNARRGRRGDGLNGESFDEAYAAGLSARADDPPARLSSAQWERWLLAPSETLADAKTGAVKLHGGRYWSEELLAALAGRPKSERSVVVRYDPDHLDRPVIVEDRQGRVIARDVEPWGKVPFLDTREARGVLGTKAAYASSRKSSSRRRSGWTTASSTGC